MADAAIIAAYETSSDPGSDQLLQLAVGSFRVGLLFGNRGESWPWAELTSIAAIQVRKLRD